MAAEADDLLRRVGRPMGIAHAAEGRSIIAFESGELARAAASITDGIELFASYGNIGCTAHAAAVVIGAPGHGDASVAIEMLAAADELRRQSGQGHRPWEIRARLGNLEDHIGAPGGTASAPAQTGREYSLSAAASLAVGALRSLTTATAR